MGKKPHKYHEQATPAAARRYVLINGKKPTDLELADVFGVCRQTIATWKEKYPDFCYAIDDALDDMTHDVVESLYKTAIGYDYDGKHYPPNQQAIARFLDARAKVAWGGAEPPAPQVNVTLTREAVDKMGDEFDEEF